MKFKGLHLALILMAGQGFAQDEAVPAEAPPSQLSFTIIEKVIAEQYFEALTHSTSIIGLDQNWINSGRASAQRDKFAKSLTFIRSLLLQPENQREWTFDPKTRRIYSNDARVNADLIKHLKVVELAYRVLPEPWLAELIEGADPKTMTYQKTVFYRLFNNGFNSAIFENLEIELKRLQAMYTYRSEPISDTYSNPNVRRRIVMVARSEAQVFLVTSLASVLKESGITRQQFIQIISDIGKGEGFFTSLNERMKIKLDYPDENGSNYFVTFRDEQRRVLNAIILEFDLPLASFEMLSPVRHARTQLGYTRLEAKAADLSSDPLMFNVRITLKDFIRALK